MILTVGVNSHNFSSKYYSIPVFVFPVSQSEEGGPLNLPCSIFVLDPGFGPLSGLMHTSTM